LPSTGSEALLKRRHLPAVRCRWPWRRPWRSWQGCRNPSTMGRFKAPWPRPAFRALTHPVWVEAIAAKRQRVVVAACTRGPRSQSRR